MKKRLTVSILTGLCVLIFACCFAACKHEPPQTSVAVESVTLDRSEIALEIGEEKTLAATVLPENATTKTVTWSVAPDGVVTIENGKLKAVAVGEAVVTASAGGKTATCNVSVRAGSRVTEEAWVSAFSAPVDVYTMTSHQAGYDDPIVYKFDFKNQIFSFVLFSASASSPVTGSGSHDASQSEMVSVDYILLQKVGELYYRYDLMDDQTWDRQVIVEAEYDSLLNTYVDALPAMMSQLKEMYAAFDYSEGKYSSSGFSFSGIRFDTVSVVFEEGILKSLDLLKNDQSMSVHVDFGIAQIELPEIETSEEGERISGDYYLVEFGETEWQVNLSAMITFAPDGTCGGLAPARYSVEGDVIVISYEHGAILYAVLEGKIMWIFSSVADTDHVERARNALYGDTIIAKEDLVRIDSILGEPQI